MQIDGVLRPDPFEDEPVVHRRARALIGWMAEAEGVATLLGRGITGSELPVEQRALAEAFRVRVAGMPRYEPVDPVVNDTPVELSEIAQREELIATFVGVRWRIAVVDLRKVLSFQKIVEVEGIEERLGSLDDYGRLVDLCLPRRQPVPPSGALSDPDGKGFTISSVNPNLRIAGGQLAEAVVSPQPGAPSVRMQAVTFLVFFGASYLQVVKYKGRSFVRDGYHRAAGLIRRGIFEVPCVLIEADSFEQLGAPQGSFTYEVLFGDHPPELRHFWDDTVAADVDRIAVRKVVRIRADEFVVPR
jgi:hypothetical protein